MTTRELTYHLHKAVFLMDKLTDDLLQEKLGLTLSSFRILMAVSRGHDICQKDVAKFWEMTEAAVSRQIDLLVERKSIRKETDAQNRRACVLSLTISGQKILDQAFEVLGKKYHEIYGVLSETERERLGESLAKLEINLCDK
jgi:DNA-binding MarR family transcriptional regulator